MRKSVPFANLGHCNGAHWWLATLRHVLVLSRDHFNAIDNRADGEAKCASGARVVIDLWQVRYRIEVNRLKETFLSLENKRAY